MERPVLLLLLLYLDIFSDVIEFDFLLCYDIGWPHVVIIGDSLIYKFQFGEVLADGVRLN